MSSTTREPAASIPVSDFAGRTVIVTGSAGDRRRRPELRARIYGLDRDSAFDVTSRSDWTRLVEDLDGLIELRWPRAFPAPSNGIDH
ncbi:hypothetical protein JCM9803A_01940 [Rhodococcus erythropolis]